MTEYTLTQIFLRTMNDLRRFALRLSALAAVMLFANAGNTGAQTPLANSFWLSMELGPSMYLGEFNSLEQQGTFGPQIGNDIGLSLRYLFNDYLGVGAYLGYVRLPYGISETARGKYANSFFGQTDAQIYPGSSVELTPENRIRAFRYSLMFEGRLPLSESFAPFINAGIGYLTYTPMNSNYVPLPTNRTGTYPTGSLTFPLGFGLQYTINDQLQIYVRGTYYLTKTDYLDGYGHYLDYETASAPPSGPGTQPTPNDYVASVTFGLSGLLQGKENPHPEITQRPPDPPQSAPPDNKEPEVEKLAPDSSIAAMPDMPNTEFLDPNAVRTEFSGIYFRQNSDDFDLSQPETLKNLRSLLDYMRSCERLRVLVEGHSSSEGTASRNKSLSTMRAKRVSDWLVANGIPKDRILGVVGYGYGLPKIEEPTSGAEIKDVTRAELEELRKQNRRITVLVRRNCDQ